MSTRLYKHGTPFSEILNKNIDDLLARVDLNKASLIIVDGTIGEGKTTLACEIADYINYKTNLDPIDFEQQLALGGEQFQEKLRVCYEKKLPCIVYDEAGDFNRRGALSRFNAQLNRTFETFRAFKIIPILSLPLFSVLDNDLFNKGIPRILLHLKDRKTYQGEFMGYSLYRMFYLREKINKMIVKPMAYSYTEPNFYGHFLNLSPERSRDLDVFSTKGKLEILQRTEMESQGLYNVAMMASKYGKSVGHLRNLILKLGLKAKKRIKKTMFFTEDQQKAIGEYLISHGYKR